MVSSHSCNLDAGDSLNDIEKGFESTDSEDKAVDMMISQETRSPVDSGISSSGESESSSLSSSDAAQKPKPPVADGEGESVPWRSAMWTSCRLFALIFRSVSLRCKASLFLFVSVVAILLEISAQAWVSVLLNDLFNEMIMRDEAGFYSTLTKIGAIAISVVPVCIGQEAAACAFGLEWRRCLTEDLLDKYVANGQAYYRLKTQASEIDNPDQRIGQDVAKFVEGSVKLLMQVVRSIFQILVVSGLLIAISYRLYLTTMFGAMGITILLLKCFGGRFMRLTRIALSQEASFRFALIRIREHAESIAFFQGGPFEHSRSSELFGSVIGTYYQRLSTLMLIVGGQRSVALLAPFLPTIFLGHLVLHGDLNVGDLIQTNTNFTSLLVAASALVTDIQAIAELGAQAARIHQLHTALDTMKAGGSSGHCVELHETLASEQMQQNEDSPLTDMTSLRLTDVNLFPPGCDAPMISKLSAELKRSQTLFLCGESGVGKSTLLRAIGGLWARGDGCIERYPSDRCFFMPQQPYICLGSLRENVLYPKPPPTMSPWEDLEGALAIKKALQAVGLGYLVERHGLDIEVDFETILSGGEKQRLGFARLLVREDIEFALLDEATSALDAQNEELVYRLLAERVQSYVSVGHRAALEKFHTHRLHLHRPHNGTADVGAAGFVEPMLAAEEP